MEKLIDPDRALALVLAQVRPAPPRQLPLEQAGGLILAEAVQADRDYPPFDRAAMDGFAVRLADAGRTLQVGGVIAAGSPEPRRLEGGGCLEIMTGAACPEGTEAVVMKEAVRREGDRVSLPAQLSADQNMARRGGEARAGALVLEPGWPLTPLAVAVLASFGRAEVAVHPPPRLAVITTGDELVPVAAAPRAGQIRDSNGPMLIAQVRQAGLPEPLRLHAADTLASLRATLEEAAAADLVLLTGGVSAGRYDLVPAALAAAGAEIIFHKVTQKPGKPFLLARRERKDQPAQLYFGLPGNPVSSFFCCHRYVLPAARAWMGRPRPGPEPGRGRLLEPLPVRSDRTLYVPALVEGTAATGQQLRPLPGQGSADIFAVWRAQAFLRQPAELPLAAGAEVDFEWIGEPR